jgi:hypothetical protein
VYAIVGILALKLAIGSGDRPAGLSHHSYGPLLLGVVGAGLIALPTPLSEALMRARPSPAEARDHTEGVVGTAGSGGK